MARSEHRARIGSTAGIFAVKMPVMYARALDLPERTFFLFGPRGTGKTTWLRSVLPKARWYDLLHDRELLRLMRDPAVFAAEVAALDPGDWVVVDEVQRFPGLLNEVQAVITQAPGRNRFALTGSSARRIRREGANLLPGRAINRMFFPLTVAEMGGQPDIGTLLRFGGLPAVCMEPDQTLKADLLSAYVANYVGQEVRIEAAVRDLDAFVRFLEVAALANGQVVNVAGVAREAAVARTTVQGFVEALVDLLLGAWVPPLRARAKIKEVGHPKFYLFDPGVTRALAGRLSEPLDSLDRGSLLETWVLHELRAYANQRSARGRISYWRTRSGTEVDFVWSRGERSVGIEVEASARWRPEFDRGLTTLLQAGSIERAFGVYLGDAPQRRGPIEVLPLTDFLRALGEGRVIG